MPRCEQLVDQRRQPVLVKTLAQRVVERHVRAAGTSARSRLRRTAGTPATAGGFRRRRRAAWPSRPARPRRCSDVGPKAAAAADVGVGRRLLRLLIVHQPADQPIQPGKLLDGIPPIGLLVAEVAPAVEDHAELRAPVADVVVADDRVAEEPQHAAQGVADHRRADVADVHRLGHVRGGVSR